MFVDASALVAILTEEPDGPGLAAQLARAGSRITSALAIYETALSVARIKRWEPDRAHAFVLEYIDQAQMIVVPIGAEEAALALDAHARFGKGRHPARLNMGDCFAYACGRRHGVPLLYKGGDFALTDIESA